MSHRWRKSWSYMEVVWNLNESWKMYVTVWVISRPWCWATVKKRRQYLIVLDSQKKWLWFLCSQRNNNVCRIKHNQLSFKTGYNPIISKLAQHTWTHKKRTQLHLHFSVPFFSFCVLISQEQYLVRKKQLWQSSHLASISKWGSAIIVNQRQLTPLQFHQLPNSAESHQTNVCDQRIVEFLLSTGQPLFGEEHKEAFCSFSTGKVSKFKPGKFKSDHMLDRFMHLSCPGQNPSLSKNYR